MPIVRPLSKRNFLKTSVAGALASVLGLKFAPEPNALKEFNAALWAKTFGDTPHKIGVLVYRRLVPGTPELLSNTEQQAGISPTEWEMGICKVNRNNIGQQLSALEYNDPQFGGWFPTVIPHNSSSFAAGPIHHRISIMRSPARLLQWALFDRGVKIEAVDYTWSLLIRREGHTDWDFLGFPQGCYTLDQRMAAVPGHMVARVLGLIEHNIKPSAVWSPDEVERLWTA